MSPFPTSPETKHPSRSTSPIPETETETTSRATIYAELAMYLNNLKAGTGAGTDEDDDDAGVTFPSNYDEIVQCMTRSDLISPRSNTNTNPNAEPFSNPQETREEKEKETMDWSKIAIMDSLAQTPLYKKYSIEFNREKNERNRLQSALAKVTILDRKISLQEYEHDLTLEKYEAEVNELRKEVDFANVHYENVYGCVPPGGNKDTHYNNNKGSPIKLTSDSLEVHDKSSKNRTFITGPGSKSSTSGAHTARTDRSDRTATQLKAQRKEGAIDYDYASIDELKEYQDPDQNNRDRGKKLANRNMQMAARAGGKSSLTDEEEARINLLLGPDIEGDEYGGVGEAGDSGYGYSEDVYSEGVYGGVNEKNKIASIDSKLKEMGVYDRLTEDAESQSQAQSQAQAPSPRQLPPDPPKERGEGVLRARARARAEKSKERSVDDALRALKNAPLALVRDADENGSEDKVTIDSVSAALSAPITGDDIKRIIEETASDMNVQDFSSSSGGVKYHLAQLADIKVLLSNMTVELEKQRGVRDEVERRKRRDIEDVVNSDAARGGEEGVKKWGDDIGEVYQSGWVEGIGGEEEGEFYDYGDDDDEIGGEYKYEDESDYEEN